MICFIMCSITLEQIEFNEIDQEFEGSVLLPLNFL